MTHNNVFLRVHLVILVYFYTYITQTCYNLSFSFGNYICGFFEIYKTLLTSHEHWDWRAACVCLLVYMVPMSLSHWSVDVTGPNVTSGKPSHGFSCTELWSVPWKWWMMQDFEVVIEIERWFHGWGWQVLASHHTGPGSISGQSMRDLLLTKWQWSRFFSEYLNFHLSVSFHQCPTLVPSCITDAT